MTTGFSFKQFRGEGAGDLKRQLAQTGETFDVLGVEEDMGDYGPMWKVRISHGDGSEGYLFFGQSQGERVSSRDEMFINLIAHFQTPGAAAIPAMLRSVPTRRGNDYYWLDDPA